MGLEYLHFVTPRAPTWSPPADIVFDVDRSLRRIGLAHGEATVFDPTLWLNGRPKKRGKLGPRVELGGEVLVNWEPSDEGAHTAGFLFGDADYHDEGLFCEVSYQSGPAYKVEARIDGGFFELEDADRERAKDGFDLRCRTRIPRRLRRISIFFTCPRRVERPSRSGECSHRDLRMFRPSRRLARAVTWRPS